MLFLSKVEGDTTMFIQLALFGVIAATCRGSEIDPVRKELGKGVNLRKINLLDDFQEEESSVFEPFPEKCFEKKKLHKTGSSHEYYASTKDFYSKMAGGAGLDASLQSSFTLGVTLSSVFKKIESKQSQISGMSLKIRALTEKFLVTKDCFQNKELSTLSKNLVEDFERLPMTISKPWLANSWKAYSVFLQTYGSHVITSVKRGASIRQTTFAESSKSYSQRDFQVKSCVSLAGPTSVGKVGVKACANVSKEEVAKTSSMNTVDNIVLRGGTLETRNALRGDRTEKLIEKFLNEAGESDSAIEHTFRSLWSILQSRFGIGSDNYVRAVNLQYYYLGYLNYGCRHSESGGVHMQKFDYTKNRHQKTSPEFECTLAAEGCHSDSDCHYKPVWCSCRGSSCVHYKKVNQDTGAIKITAYANTDQDWGWQGCDWYVAGSYCKCYNHKNQKVVWRMPSRDFPQKEHGHTNFDALDESGSGKVEEEEYDDEPN